MKCTMRLLTHERTCQPQFDDNQAGPSVAETSVLVNAHGDMRRLGSERPIETIEKKHVDGVSKGVVWQNMECVLHIPVIRVSMGVKY